MQHITFTVTNDLNYDQRMIRICNSLKNAGYEVTLVGRKLQSSKPLINQAFRQRRLNCFFEKGKLFYVEYNLRLLIYLLFTKTDCICAIDLDSIIPVYHAAKFRNKKKVYDAHELFCEMKEIVSRPKVYDFWKWIERKYVPHFKLGYTVNDMIAEEFKKMYSVQYPSIRNIAHQKSSAEIVAKEKFILYQGAVNEGRCFETLIPAMRMVNAPLIICGSGNFLEQTKALVKKYDLEEKVIFKGLVLPEDLNAITQKAYIGLTTVEHNGLSNYYSLANRFFDYVQGHTPQVCVNFPVYAALNRTYEVAEMIDDTTEATIATAINKLLNNESHWQKLMHDCKKAAEVWNWENEERILINFYNQKVFG